MRILVHRIDSKGFFVEDVLVGLEETSNPIFITTKVPEGMIKPMWDGTQWVEKGVPLPVEETPILPTLEGRLKALEDTVMLLLDTGLEE